MPRAKEIFARGSLRKMKVTLPEISSVSWTSFMTGMAPGEHGIYGFTDLKPDSYDMTFPSYPDLPVKTLWERLAEKGKRSVVINQPATYPARPIEGALISGFVAIDLRQAVHPKFLYAKLQQLGYEIDIDAQEGGKNADSLFKQLETGLRGRRKAWDYLWNREKWDYFQVVVTGTDRLMHFQMPAAYDPAHPEFERFRAYYSAVDSFLGEVFERYVEKTGDEAGEGFWVLSDHGFCAIEQEFYVNAWLRSEGYLSFENDPAKSLGEITPESRAFALDPGRIYVHRSDRYPKGSVAPADAAGVADEIRAKLLALEHGGAAVCQAVHQGEELYSGAHANRAPDLVLTARDGYDSKGWLGPSEPFGRSHFTGMHNWDDAFVWNASELPESMVITDIAPRIESRLSQ